MCTYGRLDAANEHLRVPVVELHVFDAKEPRGVGIGQGSSGSSQGSSGNRLIALLVGVAAVDDDRHGVFVRGLAVLRGRAARAAVGLVGGAVVVATVAARASLRGRWARARRTAHARRRWRRLVGARQEWRSSRRQGQRCGKRIFRSGLMAADGGRTKPADSASERCAVQLSVCCEMNGSLRRWTYVSNAPSKLNNPERSARGVCVIPLMKPFASALTGTVTLPRTSTLREGQ
jgi:hypothetical protein